MQMMVEEKNAQKEWLKKAVMETFTARELEKMAEQKRKKAAPKRKGVGIKCGLPEGYDSY